MLNSLALLALAAASTLASPTPQGVTSAIPPEAPAPEGCQPSYSGSFQISAVNVTSSSAKRDLERRQDGVLLLTLQNSVLTDQAGRTGYVAANYQFQFDAPPQAGAIYTSGFSLCSNGSLALGGSAIWYQCLSGSFYNLYDRNWAEHCNAIYLYALIGSTAPPASQGSDGQVTVTQDAATVTQIPDGQIQATTGVPVSQIPDGQIQATTGVPVSQIPDGQIQATTGVPVSQIPDGQIQATTGVPVSQISDGQIQATTGGPAITQISDGQIQAPTATVPPVSQISDGQIQAPTATVPPVSQISDGQIQAPTATVPPVSQISDGQIQAPTGTTAAPATFTGAAHRAELGGSMALIAGIAGAVALL